MNIKIKELTKSYDNRIVLNLSSLTLDSGINFIIGNNGAGKSTLFKMILNLIEPDNGYVLIEDKNIIEEYWKSYTGAYLDESYLISFLNCKEYFGFLFSIYNMDDYEKKEFEFEFEFFLKDILSSNKRISDLSKGNKAKIGIASCFLGNNKIIILDEPFANLDHTSQLELEKILLNRRKSIILLTSHHYVNIMKNADRVLFIENGYITKDLSEKNDMIENIKLFFQL